MLVKLVDYWRMIRDNMSRPEIVYEKTWEVLVADVLHVERAKRENPALLLEGGRTAHSRFAIPINVVDDSMCHISADSELAELIRMAKTDPTTPNDMVFGGKVVLFGGNFQQILPVVTNGSRQDVVHASINTSYLWKDYNVMRQTENMRLGKGANYSEKKEIQDFADWLLSIGNGTIGGKNDGETTIEFPHDILIPDSSDHIGSLIEETYPHLIQNLYNPTFFQEKSILAPTHTLVDMINDRMLELIPGDEKTYESSYSVGIVDMDTNFIESLYTSDFLNNIKVAGLPQHSLKLKIGAPVMCMRNVDQRAGLCNGTRLQILRLGINIIEAKIISGGNIG
ncbi:ATP-dependent DNA helicase PIF1-like protein, partial [Tanacetum coccineum]